MKRFLVIFLSIVFSSCSQKNYYNPHDISDYPKLSLEVIDSSINSREFRISGKVMDVEYSEPITASLGIGRMGKRIIADSTGNFTFVQENVRLDDTLIIYHPGWDTLMKSVSELTKTN